MAYVTTVLHKGEEWWGFINTSYYVGTLIGGLLAWKMSTYIQNNLIRSMAIGSLLFSILTFLYGITSSGFIALFLCILMGPCYQIRDISQTTVLQSSVAPSLLSKMYTAHGTLLNSFWPFYAECWHYYRFVRCSYDLYSRFNPYIVLCLFII